MKTLSIKNDKLCCIRYDIIMAGKFHYIYEHPIDQMNALGIHLIKAILETTGDCWICLTDYQGELPDYITKIPLKVGDWYWKNWDINIIE